MAQGLCKDKEDEGSMCVCVCVKGDSWKYSRLDFEVTR